MRRLIVIVCGILLSVVGWAGIHRYADQSVLREGNIVKVRVSETGVHCIPFDTLKAWGLHPADVRVLGYGGQMLSENFTLAKWDDVPSVAFYMERGADGVFNSGDYILFYAQGTTRWVAVDGIWCHTQNPYSRYGYYFISDSAGEQRLINNTTRKVESSSDIVDVDWYTYYAVHEKDSFNLVDLTGASGGGREFYGERISEQKPRLNILFPINGVRSDLECICRTSLAVASSQVSTLQVKFDDISTNYTAPALLVSDFYTKAELINGEIKGRISTTSNPKVEITYKNPPTGATAYLNYIAVNIPCTLNMSKNGMSISNISYLNQTEAIRFHMSNATANTQIWRVTDGVNIERMNTKLENGQLIWIGDNTTAEKYIAITPTKTGWHHPVKVGTVPNQNLHALTNIDYVIICPSDFVGAATKLAQKHEEVDALTWAVVTDQQVYNEFSSGTPDASAYRWLMKMLYDRRKTDHPMSLLLLGHGTFDNRKIYKSSGEATLLTYQAYNSTKETTAYATDDYFGFMQDNAGIATDGSFNDISARMDISVGRLPAKNLQEANDMANKLCRYMDNSTLGKWKSQILFLADDGDHGIHVQSADLGAELLYKNNKSFILNKIYLDAHAQEVNAAGETYPIAKNQFDNLMNNGVLFMSYSGHGGYNNITNELFMKSADIKRMNNRNQAFWFLATCSFSHFDGGVVSAGEEAMLNPNGGAISVLSSCRTVYASQNEILQKHLCDTLFGHKDVYNYNMTIGEATRIAKNQTGRSDMNKMPYILLGDPALRLNYPCDYTIETTTRLDTLHALSTQTIEGYIHTSDNDTAHWFNGKIDITIFDKMQVTATKDNDEPVEEKKIIRTYNDYPNIIFTGQADVVDGKFSFTFIVPKDIRYNYGNGRIAYYAHDDEMRQDAIGYFEDFIIGGSSTVNILDTLGPDLRIYLNTPAFTDGGRTYEYPHFYADIYDEHGINTVGSGIGHDLLLVVDNDPKQTYVLNNYFTANNNSYQQGLVSYNMSQQSEGAHSLMFRAWDLFNNSSTAILNFQVIKGLGPQIYNVLTYPNPVSISGILNIDILHDQPDETIETIVNVYDISGKRVYAYQQTGTQSIAWDIASMGLTAGIYIYQVNIKTPTSEYTTKAGKIIITN